MNNEKKLDALKEIFNIGVGNATYALYKLINSSVMITVPDIFLISIDKAIEKLSPLDKKVFSFYIKISNGINGGILIIFDENSAKNLYKCVNNKEVDENDSYMIGFLKEVANIITSYFLNTLAKLLKKSIMPEVPSFAYDMKGAVVDYVFSEHKNKELNVLFIITQIFCKEHFKLKFLLIPEEETVEEILKKV